MTRYARQAGASLSGVERSERTIYTVRRYRPETRFEDETGTVEETGREVVFVKNYFSESAAYYQLARWRIYDKRHEVRRCTERYGHHNDYCDYGGDCEALREQHPRWRVLARRLARWLRWRDRRLAASNVFPMSLPDGSVNLEGFDALLRAKG